MTDTEMKNLLKLQAAKGKFFSRITLTNDDGSKYDVARITRATGSGAAANMQTGGKIAFIINNKLYNETQFKRLFKKDKASYGPSIGVGGGSKELSDRGFNLDGYDLVFEFDPGATSKVTNAPVKTGAIPGKNGNNIKALKQTLATMPGIEVRADGTLWANNQPVKRALINGKEYIGSDLAQVVDILPADIINKVTVTNTPKILVDGKEFIPREITEKVKVTTPKILVDGKEFIPREITEKVKVTNTPKILVDGKEFIPNNIDTKKDLLNSAPKVKAEYKKPNDSLVAARFSGKVVTVKEILGTNIIIIRNGDYFAAYSNLKNMNVSSGQEIKAGQFLGVAAAFNREENKVAAHFELYRRQTQITDKTEQETIISTLGSPKLNMINSFKNMYASTLPQLSKPL